MPQLFLSYSWSDKTIASAVASVIERHGCSVWLDDKDLVVGDTMLAEIHGGLAGCDFHVVVVSASSIVSPWVKRELDYSLHRELSEGRVIVLPMVIDGCALPIQLAARLHIQVTDVSSVEPAVRELRRAVAKHVRATGTRQAAGCHGRHGSGLQSKPVTPVLAGTAPRDQPRDSGVPPVEALPVGFGAVTEIGGPLPSSVLGVSAFASVRIVGIDDSRTTRSNGETTLLNVCFRLNQAPPAQWVVRFELQRTFLRSPASGRAWVDGDRIMVQCGFHEVREARDSLVADVRDANARYLEDVQAQASLNPPTDGSSGDVRAMVADELGATSDDDEWG